MRRVTRILVVFLDCNEQHFGYSPTFLTYRYHRNEFGWASNLRLSCKPKQSMDQVAGAKMGSR